MIEVGVITETDRGKARVAIGSMVSDFLPVLQYSLNSFALSFRPFRVGEQVLVMPIRGDLNSGVILGSIEQNSYLAPSYSKHIIRYEDGAIISYDTSTSTLEVLNQKDINIVVNNSVNITANSVNITAPNVNISASSSVVATTPVFSISGSLNVGGGISGGAKGGGGLSIIGNANIRGDISTNGNISDSRGDLTNHSHNDSDGYTSYPR